MVLFGPGCKLLRCERVEARMRSVIVVMVTPAPDDLAGMAVTPEQVLGQTFIAQVSFPLKTGPLFHRDG